MIRQTFLIVLCISTVGIATAQNSSSEVLLKNSEHPQVAAAPDRSLHVVMSADRNILPGQNQLELRKKADVVRATADELKFMRIPWVTDLFQGFRLAEEEKRPVFLYLITGDPLEDS